MQQLSPCTTATEAQVPRAPAPQQEKPQLESSTRLLQLEKAGGQQQRPVKNKQVNIKKRVQRFPIYPMPLYTCIVSIIINIPHQSGAFVTISETTSTRHHHPKSIIYSKALSWCYTFYGFAQMYNDIYQSL